MANVYQRLRLAGILIVLGLVIEAWTLHSNNPIAFVIFLGLGGILLSFGSAVYLWSLLSIPSDTTDLK